MQTQRHARLIGHCRQLGRARREVIVAPRALGAAPMRGTEDPRLFSGQAVSQRPPSGTPPAAAAASPTHQDRPGPANRPSTANTVAGNPDLARAGKAVTRTAP